MAKRDELAHTEQWIKGMLDQMSMADGSWIGTDASYWSALEGQADTLVGALKDRKRLVREVELERTSIEGLEARHATLLAQVESLGTNWGKVTPKDAADRMQLLNELFATGIELVRKQTIRPETQAEIDAVQQRMNDDQLAELGVGTPRKKTVEEQLGVLVDRHMNLINELREMPKDLPAYTAVEEEADAVVAKMQQLRNSLKASGGPEHVCGLQGFGRGAGSQEDTCPACGTQATQKRMHADHLKATDAAWLHLFDLVHTHLVRYPEMTDRAELIATEEILKEATAALRRVFHLED